MTAIFTNGHFVEPAFITHYQDCPAESVYSAGKRFVVGATDVYVGGNAYSGYARLVLSLIPRMENGKLVSSGTLMDAQTVAAMDRLGIPLIETAPNHYRSAAPIRYVSDYRAISVPNPKYRGR